MENAPRHCHANVMTAHPLRVSYRGDNSAATRRAPICSEGILTDRPFLQSPFVAKSSEHRAWATGQAPAMWAWPLRNRRSRKTQPTGSTRPLYDHSQDRELARLGTELEERNEPAEESRSSDCVHGVRHADVLRGSMGTRDHPDSGGARDSSPLAPHMAPCLMKGEGDSSARHPWRTCEDLQVNGLVEAIYGLRSGADIHTGWQVGLHDPIPDMRGKDLDHHIIGGVTDVCAKPLAVRPSLLRLPPPPPPSPALPAARRVERIVLRSVHFDCGKSRFTLLGRQTFGETTRRLQANPARSVEIEGHTDAIGTELYNRGRGQRHAEAILRVSGVASSSGSQAQVCPKRMTTLSYGGTRPIADNRADQGRGQDRRVEFKVLMR